MKDFRGPLPLTDADFTRIRANVMAKVRPRRTAFAFRWAFAMLAAAFVGVVSYKSLHEPAITISTPPLTVTHTPPPPVTKIIIAPPAVVAVVDTPAPIVARRRTHRKPTNQPTNQPTDQPTFRMEIQTADPDIRIIWLPTQYDPKSEESS